MCAPRLIWVGVNGSLIGQDDCLWQIASSIDCGQRSSFVSCSPGCYVARFRAEADCWLSQNEGAGNSSFTVDRSGDKAVSGTAGV